MDRKCNQVDHNPWSESRGPGRPAMIWRNKSEIYGSEQRGTGTIGRNTLNVKTDSTSAGVKSDTKHSRHIIIKEDE